MARNTLYQVNTIKKNTAVIIISPTPIPMVLVLYCSLANVLVKACPCPKNVGVEAISRDYIKPW